MLMSDQTTAQIMCVINQNIFYLVFKKKKIDKFTQYCTIFSNDLTLTDGFNYKN